MMAALERVHAGLVFVRGCCADLDQVAMRLCAVLDSTARLIACRRRGTSALDLDETELAIVLAGLRMIQRMGVSSQEEEIATNGGQFDPLDDDDIDALCERLNA